MHLQHMRLWLDGFAMRGTMEERHQLDLIKGFELDLQCGMALVSHRELYQAARHKDVR